MLSHSKIRKVRPSRLSIVLNSSWFEGARIFYHSLAILYCNLRYLWKPKNRGIEYACCETVSLVKLIETSSLTYLDDLATAEHSPHEPSDRRGIATDCIPVWMGDGGLIQRDTTMLMLRPPRRVDIGLLSGRLTV